MQKRISRGEAVFNVVNYIFLAFCVIITLLPFVTIIAKSFSDTVAIESGKVFLWPVDFNTKAYKNLIADGQLLRSMKNTVIITVVGTVLNMIFTTTAAYALSKKRLLGGKFIMKMMTFTMIFSGGTIPHFIVVKSLGLMNTYGALWLPGLITVYNLIVMKSFFEQLPESLEEAARIDGANDLLIFFKIVLPLSLATIATITLFYAVSWWNEYFNGMIYISSSSKMPLQVKLRQMIATVGQVNLTETDGETMDKKLAKDAVQAAAMVISTIPMLCIYPFLQKYFVKGVMVGAVKG
ncbi:MAG: carbohydrate ABC transporter permease [Clostridia bacterium]|nr:carbohydrate ABC transporter permease [Oscillospiraceae bacterium]MDY5626730.1 carbohydrate ABC transporter permease [Clostridia bacterium]